MTEGMNKSTMETKRARRDNDTYHPNAATHDYPCGNRIGGSDFSGGKCLFQVP